MLSDFSHFFVLSIAFPLGLFGTGIYLVGKSLVESLVPNTSVLIRFIFFLAMKTVIIVTMLVWVKGKGKEKLIQRGKGTLKKY